MPRSPSDIASALGPILDILAPRPCARRGCVGGTVPHWKDWRIEPESARRREPCRDCDGEASRTAPSAADFLAVFGRPRKGKTTLKSKRPSDPRVGYIWRMTRFHSGLDCTLPMTASCLLGADPFRDVLDGMAELAAACLGARASLGSLRWRQAVHGDVSSADIVAAGGGSISWMAGGV